MLAMHALSKCRCVSAYGGLHWMIVSGCTYNTPKLKIVTRPTLPFVYNCRPHTLAIGTTRMTRSENVLMAAEHVCAAFWLRQWPDKRGYHAFCTGRHWKASPMVPAR